MNTAVERDLEQAVARGSELLKQGNLDDAQLAFRAALSLDEGNPRILALLGLTHFRAGQFDAARPIYEQLVEKAPTDASHRMNLGLLYLKIGDADNAIAALEASRALDPSQGRAVNYLGLAYARAGRYPEAYRSFLIAGQKELAKEIEINLTQGEREAIHSQLQRTGVDAPAVARTTTPGEPTPPAPAPHAGDEPPPIAVARTRTPPPPPPPARAPKAAEPPEPEQAAPQATEDIPSGSHPQLSSPEIRIVPPSMTESAMFVLPQQPAAAPVPVPADGRSAISRAVEAAPAAHAAATAAPRTVLGGEPPMPLSQLATTDLVRPDDNEHPFEVTSNGTLVIRCVDRVLTRLEGIHVSGGDLAYEPAMRRSRGHQTDEPFAYGGVPMHAIEGRGYLIAVPGDKTFTAVALDDDIFYLREDLVYAFEPTLRWENGNVPGLRGRLPVVQFRGDGAVVIRTGKPLVRVKLPAQGVVFVDATRLAGWIGRVIPRAVVPPDGGPMGDVCVECTGEGVVLVDPVGDPGKPIEREKKPSVPPPPPQPSAPQPESAEALAASLAEDPDLAGFASLGEGEPTAPSEPTEPSERDEF